MTEINRRGLIGVAGAGLVVAACSGKTGETGQGRVTKDDFEITTFDPIWNFGKEPWEPVPDGGNKTFDPAYLCVVYIVINADLKISVKRVHRVANKTPANNWDNNTANAVDIINRLNGSRPLPATDKVYNGFKQFNFGQPHHIVFYVKNASSKFDPEYPIWFGKKLRNEFNGSKRAEPNQSFFNSRPQTLSTILNSSTSPVSQSVVYVENHFKAGDASAHGPIPTGKDLMYSLNLNLVVPTAEDNNYTVPLIIDPDTGNMGSGGPP